MTIPLLALLAFADLPKSPKQFFDSSKIWTIHVSLSADAYKKMEPTGGPGGLPGFGGPGGPGMRGPGGPGPMFGPGAMLAPAFLAADQDRNQRITREEFNALAAKWFADWDTGQSGKLSEAQLREGLSKNFAMPAMPAMPGGPGPMPAMKFPKASGTLEIEGAKLPNVAFRYKGNSTYMASRGALKRSLKIELNEFTKGQKFLGLETLNVHSNVMDPSWMNETISYQAFREAGIPAPRTTFARVYLSVEGQHNRQYLGLFSVVEEVDGDFEKSNFKEKDGALFKPENRALFNYLGEDWSKYDAAYDPKGKITPQQAQRIVDFSKLVTKATDAEFAAQAPQYLDLENWARYMAVNVWLANMDSILAMGHNYYLYLHPKTQKLSIHPWDLDLSFGGLGGGPKLNIAQPWRGQNRFLERLYALPEFQKRYREILSGLDKKVLSAARLNSEVDRLAAQLRDAVREESPEKLANFEKLAKGENVPRPMPGFGAMRGNRGPGSPGGPGGFNPGGFPIKAFASSRAESVRDQLAGKAQGDTGANNFGPFGGPGGMPGGIPNPAMFLAPSFLEALDSNQDRSLTREEFTIGFTKWFDQWSNNSESLTPDQLRAGLNQLIRPPF